MYRVLQNAFLVVLSIILILSAFLKSLDWTVFAVQVSYYGIVREPSLVKGIALGLIGLEAALGMALLLRLALRRATLPATFALLAGFTALLAWAWAFRDLKNCGCFGKFLPMTPPEAILKNVVMMAMVAFAWYGLRKRDNAISVGAGMAASTTAACAGSEAPADVSSTRAGADVAASATAARATTDGALSPTGGGLSCPPESDARGPSTANSTSATQFSARPPRNNRFALRNRHVWRLSVSMAAAVAAMAFAVLNPFNGGSEAAALRMGGSAVAGGSKFAAYPVEWEGKRLDLAKGLYVVALLSDSCEHCAEIVDGLNRLSQRPDFPPIAGLILGEEDTLRSFRQTYRPRFATRLIPVLEFFDLIGDAPPRFYVLRDGKSLKYWDENLPAEAAFREALPELPPSK
jgi:hypothetical protein